MLVFLGANYPTVDFVQMYLRSGRFASVESPGQGFLRRLILNLGFVGLEILCHLKLSVLDKVDSIDTRIALLVDFLAPNELPQFHLLEDVLQALTSQIGKDAESTKERNNLLQFALLLLLDRPTEIFPGQCGKA